MRRHFPRGQAAGVLNQPVRQRGLAVVDVGDHREIADAFDRGRRHGPARLASAGLERYGNGDRRAPEKRGPRSACGHRFGVYGEGCLFASRAIL
ncbi:hypothetical protein D3C85_1271160 [compost metagenome]